MAPSYSCEYCDKKYRHHQSRRNHLRKCHGENIVRPAKTFSCREDGCITSFSTAYELRSHLTNTHSLAFVDETEEFASMDDFQRWKEDLEHTEQANFSLRFGMKKDNDNTTGYFYCNRSGSYMSRGTGKRTAKESCRTGEFCTAYIAIKVHTASGEVSVKFCKTHYKHDKELRHLHLSSSEKAWVSAQSAEKVSSDEILKKIRDSVQDPPERLHLITKQDIANIQRACSLQGIERHHNNRTSVMLHIQELKELGDRNPILHCKLQGENQENLLDDDVFLIIQSPLQQQMLQEFGSNIICLDTTYGTSGNDFKLTSVLVVDEFGEGFPAGWCISSRDDFFTLKEFFQVLFQKCGPVNPKWIMTDDAEQYFSAWVDVFGFGPRKLLCTWQMDRAWRKKLNLIEDQQLQCDVYKILRVLLEERSEERFGELVEQIKEELMNDGATEAFGDYIRNTYLSRPKQWAYCHRERAGVNTNCEALHSILNKVYTQGDSNKGLDQCVFMLLSLINSRGADQLMKLEHWTTSSKLATIADRHRNSIELSLECVKKKRNNCFRVVPESAGNKQYLVALTAGPCKQSCKISCSECKVCIHTSFCTCTDSWIHGVICKHVHLVCRYRNKTVLEVAMPEPQFTEDVSVSPVISAVRSLRPKPHPNEELHQLLATISSQLNTRNLNSALLSEVKKGLTAISNLIKIPQNP